MLRKVTNLSWACGRHLIKPSELWLVYQYLLKVIVLGINDIMVKRIDIVLTLRICHGIRSNGRMEISGL